MKLFSTKASILIVTIAVTATSISSRADDLVDCSDPAIQKMVLQGVEDWWLLQGYPKSPISYGAFMPNFKKSTSPGTMALKRKLEGMWNIEITFCETKTIPDDGNIFMLTGFTKTNGPGGVGGFIGNFGGGAGMASFGGFDENLLR